MTSTIVPNSQAVAEWVKIFPKQVTENYTSSVTFMKQLTVVAISTITYLKNAFPEDSYTVEMFGGIKLKILKKKCRDDDAQFLSTALVQAFEAFEKRYLHQLVLCFYEGECCADNLLEHHVFEYSYLGEAPRLSVRSQRRGAPAACSLGSWEAVRDSTLSLVKASVVLLQSCQNALPPNYDISVTLYYNDDAPAEYQAPGYSWAANADPLARAAGAVRLGAVSTPFHSLRASACFRDAVPRASREAIASQNPPAISQLDDEFNDSSGSGDEPPVRCPCNKRDREPGAGAMLTCYYCGARQHAACFGVSRAHGALLARHCCAACHDAQRARRATDARLAALSDRKRESLCVFRRALALCAAEGAAHAHALAARLRVSRDNAERLLRALHSHRVVQLDDNDIDKPHEVQEEELKRVMGKFFQSGEPDIVDRLLAESVSQEAPSDPVSEVLSPLERVSLRNESTPGRVVEAGAGDAAAVEDATLKEYREAILANETVEGGADVAGVAGGAGRGEQRKSVKRRAERGGRPQSRGAGKRARPLRE